MNPLELIDKQIQSAISTIIPDTNIPDIPNMSFSLNIEPHKEQFGDITTNAALLLAKPLKKAPRQVAQDIVQHLDSSFIAKTEIAGPGFINIFLSAKAITVLGHELYQKEEDYFKTDKQPKKYNIEFVSANPTGPLHIGHGRGGIIGDVLGNILAFQQHEVTKEFYINDAGNQIIVLGKSLKARCLQAMGKKATLPEKGYHGAYLIELATQCITECGQSVIDHEVSFFSQYAKKHLLASLKQTLKHYNIHFDEWFSEKTLHESGAIALALDILDKNGYVYEKDNALWFTSTAFGDDKDRVLKKQGGELTYVAADVAYLENKLSRKSDQLIMVLGQDHHSYVQRLKGLMEALGHNPDRLDIILYQLVTLKESGTLLRMSKRAGRSVTLQDVIDTVGTDVARFFYLNRKADAHLDFDVDLALKHTDENPVYYIQYAYVRTGSILAKAQKHKALALINHSDAVFLHDTEKLLLKKIASLKNLLSNIEQNYQTHLLTYYVLELAQLFHSYYNAHKIIILSNEQYDIERSRGRLLLVQLIRQTLATCFRLLGITAPEQM